MTTFEIGALVRARGREWVVLPESRDEPDMLVVRPLGGGDDEVSGIYLPLEKVEPATFDLPDPARELGNHLSCSLLRDSVRLGFRSAAGPFRSLARIAVEPRPYQIVPLLMALKLDPVRMLIADDVGVGKTIEALLVARELLDRAEVQRIAVLCPPHLAEQWQRALLDQFHIDAALVLSSTAARLERACGAGESLFDLHPHVVVSLDYIKSSRRFDTFVRACPELVIVDEAHTCTDTGAARSTAQLRHALLKELAKDTHRHMLLVTATPHSGNVAAFRSMLALLRDDFTQLPDDLSGEGNRRHREQLAAHVIQRRRGDVRAYLASEETSETPFPQRELAEQTYNLHKEYRQFFKTEIDFCRGRVLDPTLGARRQRVRWWSALALLRSIGSSPAAAAATLRNRARSDASEGPAEADELGRRVVLDMDDESPDDADIVHGSVEVDPETQELTESEALASLAKEAEKLAGAKDAKLKKGMKLIEDLLDDGFSPIVFCRFIPTAEYLCTALRKRLSKDVTVEAVIGLLPPEEREVRVANLGKAPRRVLVCTDCLSEGINLQEHFDAVVHYDLSWNPTRHEQREGRVDRYKQPKPKVRALTFYGADNPIDLVVRKKLLEKHKKIFSALGIYVPVPHDSDRMVETLLHEIFFRERSTEQLEIEFDYDNETPEAKELNREWDQAVEREKRSRALFAQHSIKVDEVTREVQAARRALGGEADVRRFVIGAVQTMGVTVSEDGGTARVPLDGWASFLDEVIEGKELVAAFKDPAPDGSQLLTRTHPVVQALGARVLESSLDPNLSGPGRRCGVVRTDKVTRRTTLLLLRMRFHIVVRDRRGQERALLAEDATLAGFAGSPEQLNWIDEKELEKLVGAAPSGNVGPDVAREHLQSVLSRHAILAPHLEDFARRHGEELRAAHDRVRSATRGTSRTIRVEPHLPIDVLGVFVLLPSAGVG